MSALDWILFFGFLGYIVWDGTRRGRHAPGADAYFLAGRGVPWWGVGLSIMATQASAITMVGTTGQGWADGMRFVQFYFALPLAMIILCFTAVPAYHRMRVSTAYEYLGKRFDGKTRLLSAALFLILRGLSVGFVIYAPSLVLAKVFHLPLGPTIVFMGGAAIIYTAIGGLAAVIATDVKQMTVMIVGLVVAAVALVVRIPDEIGVQGAFALAREADRLQVVSLSWDPSEKYTLWSSLLGGLFLFLSYFGTDQSQVQRLLAGRSIRDTQGALLLNAVAKVPFQFLVLATGVLLFVFYTFQIMPVTFDPEENRQVAALSPDARAAYDDVVEDYDATRGALALAAAELAREDRGDPAGGPEARAAAERYQTLLSRSEALRDEARALRGGLRDTNYVFLDFILHHLPMGIVGLLLAAIFAAALSSIDSELNAMATVAVLDIYPFSGGRKLEGAALVSVSRLATVGVGAFATVFALYAGEVGSLIEAVNRVGSYIYGSLLGAFILSAIPRTTGNGAFYGILAGMAMVIYAAQTNLAFLYLNAVGTVVVVVVGVLVSHLAPGNTPARASD